MFSKQADEKVSVLCVVDNGHGMSYAEMMRMVSFGHKRPDEHCKDQFGIGFKVNICHSNIAKYSLSYTVPD
jgi:hypothetical protein